MNGTSTKHSTGKASSDSEGVTVKSKVFREIKQGLTIRSPEEFSNAMAR